MSKLSDFAFNIEEHYRINEKPIAKGGYGVVREAWDKKSDEHVAIKTMINDKLDMDASKSLLRELQLLACINHPNCLRLIAFTLAPSPQIVTPFMGNGTLADQLNKINKEGKPDEAFTPTKMMCAIYGICSAMQFLHNNSIIHRDFKPLNVFLDDKYDVCIADFGLSRKVVQNVQMTMANMGTPLYMAPELFSDEYETYTNKIDVYSFGVSYLQFFSKLDILENKKKFRSPQQLMMQVSKGVKFMKPEKIKDKQYEVYLLCTDLNPNSRPSFADLCDEFEKDEEVWFDDVNKEEFQIYVDRCKKIIEDDEEKRRIERENSLSMSVSSSSSMSSSLNSSLSSSLSTSMKKSSKGKLKKPKEY